MSPLSFSSRLLITLAICLGAAKARSADVAAEALEQATKKVQAAVESGQVAGAVHLVFQDGKVIHLQEIGTRDLATGKPMTADTLLRIYSMTKPIVSVAAMTLYEDGEFQLDDPVSKYLPAFATTQVLEKQDDDSHKRVAPKREITVRDVFRHTTGYAYGGNGIAELEQEYVRAGIKYRPPAGMLPPDMTIAQAAENLAKIPTLHHPGERFTYGFSTDLLGRLIEIWSGQSLDQFLAERVLMPLEMNDTAFHVPPEKRNRFASCHTHANNKLAVLDPTATSPFNDGFPFLSGGGGLVSTMNDYAKFCEMLVGNGQRGETRILKPETLGLMFADQLDGVGGWFRFGLGFAVSSFDVTEGDSTRKVAKYAWGGYASTDFYVSPDEQFFQIFVRQHIPSSHGLSKEVFAIVEQGMSAVDPAEHWPGWLGENRDGKVTHFRPPHQWPADLNLRWSVEVGSGYGSPLVDGDRVYVHARQGENEVLRCVSLENGETIWQQAHPTPFKMGGGGERHGKGPKSSPTLVDGRIVTFGITGELSVWDAETGALQWRRDDSLKFEPSHPNWGACTSPVVHEQRVIVHVGNDTAGKLMAFDLNSGEELWSHGSDGAAYSSPVVVEIDGVTQVVEWNHRAVVGVEIEQGTFLWEYPFPHVGTDQNMPTPSVRNGIVYVGGENRGVRAVQPRVNDGDWSVQELWHQEDVALDMSSAVIAGTTLFGFSHYDSGRLFAFQLKDGTVSWKGPPRSGQNVTFLTIPNHVVALMNSGELRVLAADPDEYRVTASYRVSDTETWAPPVMLSRGVLIKGERKLSYWTLDE